MGERLAPPSVQLTDVAMFGAMPIYGDMAIHAVIDLKRRFSVAEIEAALGETIQSFPVLGHKYVPGFFRDRWVPVADPVAASVHVAEGDDVDARTDAWVRRSIDITAARPIRVVVIERPGGTRLLLTVMHIAVDGAGIAAIGHVFAAHLCGVAPALPIEPRRDFWRALEGLRWYHWLALPFAIGLSALQPFFVWFVAAREREYPRDPAAQATWRDVVVSADELAALRARLPKGTTVNDLLVAVVGQVAASRGSGSAVVLYTMDLRRYGTAARLMAANASSILTAVVRSAPGGIVDAVREAARVTARHRRTLAGPAFMLAPYALALVVPHGVGRALVEWLAPFMVGMPLSRGFVMTNVGRIDQGLTAFGEDLEAVRIVGPNVKNFPVPVVVAYGHRGALCLHLFAPPGMGDGALSVLESEIRATLGGESLSGATRGGS